MKKTNFKEVDAARHVLELRERATLAQVKKAYRTLSKKWHPDKCHKKDADLCHEKMKEINKAYKVILNYIENYNYSFAEEKVIEDDQMEHWRKQFVDGLL